MDLKLGFLASGKGSNIKVIIDKIDQGELEAEVKIIISDNPDAPVLDFAGERGIPHYCLNERNTRNFDDSLIQLLRSHKVNLIGLAGYTKKIRRGIIEVYPNRIINIHPSLLPRYGGQGMYGMNVHRAVINSNDVESGATIHLVNSEYDKGLILAQYKVPRYKLDTPETLAERVLGIEHVLYAQTLKDIQRGIISLD